MCATDFDMKGLKDIAGSVIFFKIGVWIYDCLIVFLYGSRSIERISV